MRKPVYEIPTGIDAAAWDINAPLGRPIRHNHAVCSKNKQGCLIITRTHGGWLYCCHRCGIRGYVRYGDVLGPDQLAALYQRGELLNMPLESGNNRNEDSGDAGVELPYDANVNLPGVAVEYLAQYGLRYSSKWLVRPLWSPSMGRLIFPSYKGQRCVLWIGRQLTVVGKPGPKWLLQVAPGVCPYFAFDAPESDVVVVVEDVISAIKIFHLFSAVAILGSHLQDKVVEYLTCLRKRVIIWLDIDMASKSVSYALQLRMLGLQASPVISYHDPKTYSFGYLTKIIGGAFNE